MYRHLAAGTGAGSGFDAHPAVVLQVLAAAQPLSGMSTGLATSAPYLARHGSLLGQVLSAYARPLAGPPMDPLLQSLHPHVLAFCSLSPCPLVPPFFFTSLNFFPFPFSPPNLCPSFLSPSRSHQVVHPLIISSPPTPASPSSP